MTGALKRVTRVRAIRSFFRVASCLAAALLTAIAASGAPEQERNDAPTFSRDIASFLFEHCAVCHRPGGPGPMSLLSYREVRPWARAIGEQVSARGCRRGRPNPITAARSSAIAV